MTRTSASPAANADFHGARSQDFDQGNADKNTMETVFALLRRTVPEGVVLDVPSGAGSFSRRLLAAGYRVRAGDIVENPQLEGAEFAHCDLNERLDLEDASVDAVVCIEGIEHLRRPFDFVDECARVLRPGGTLILTTPNISALRSRWRWLLTGFHNKCKVPLDENHPEPRHHINMLSFPEIRYMLHTSGLRITDVTTNRVKPISWLYLPLVPLQWLAARITVAQAKDRDLDRDVARVWLDRPRDEDAPPDATTGENGEDDERPGLVQIRRR